MGTEKVFINQPLKRGDISYFEYLYKTYFRKSVFYATQYLRDEEEAREVAQETFITLWEKRGEINNELSIQAYILTITRNKCLNLLRKKIATRKYADTLEARENRENYKALSDESANPLHLKELEQLIQETMIEMPEKMKTVFRMNRDEELTYPEIAERLGVSVKTVEYRISKALLLFREKLKDYLPLFLLYMIGQLLL
ncbi:MAG: RNA polymerase sigma-70 factor [Odoribacter sp.]